MCVACRPSLHVLFVCLFVLTCFICQPLRCASLVLTYDRASLLNLQVFANALLLRNGSHYTPPPILSSIPGYLRRWPCSLPAWRRRRRRGKRGGIAVKLRLALLNHRERFCSDGVFEGCAVRRRSLDPIREWIIPLAPTAAVPVFDVYAPAFSPRFYRGGVCLKHLRSLPRAKQRKESTTNPLYLRMTLINTRSVTNKTFILSDLFSSRNLDFLFLTETWLCPGDLSPFSELLPPKCLFFNSPRTTGRGGGLVSIFKDHFICRSVASNNYSSFELQLFVLELGDPLLIAVIYRPPKFNTNFLTEFAEFLGDVTLKYDKLLVLCDFNVHVWSLS